MMSTKVHEVFHVDKPILAMLHLGGFAENRVHERAKREIEQYYANGVDAILVEDYFGSPRDVEWALGYLSATYPDQVFGVNLLGDPERAFVLAERYGATFLQIDSVCGHLRPGQNMSGHDVDDLYAKTCDGDFAERLSELRALHPQVFLLGGVRFKYQPVRSGRSLKEDLALGRRRCDAVVVTGTGTGVGTELTKIWQFRDELGSYPLFVGAGMTHKTCREQLALADGAIVGSYFKEGGLTEAPVDPERVRRFMRRVFDVRARSR